LSSSLRRFVFLSAFVLIASAASAQTPGPPSNLTGSLNADNTISLQWAAPTTGGAPTGYLVQIGTATGGSDVLNEQIGNVLSYQSTITVPDGATYFIRVRALNSSGISNPSNELTVTRTCVSPTDAPSSLTWRASATAVQITWVPVSDVADYRIEIGSAPGLSDVIVVTGVGNTRTFVSIPLPAAGTYYARVRATRACGAGPASAELTIIAAATPPSTAIVVNEFGSFLELKNISAAPVDISSLRIHTTTGLDQIVTRLATVRQGTTLPPGCTYLMAAPGTIAVTADEPLASAVVDGVAVIRQDGFIIDAAGRRNSFDVASVDTPYIEGTALPSRSSTPGVQSFARAGDQDTNNNAADFIALATATPQNSSACTAPPPPPPPPPPGPTAPQPPTNLNVTVNGGTVTLSWTAPPASTGGPLLSYRLEAGFAPGAANAALFDLGPTVTTLVVQGVPNGTFYVRVRAINAAGVSGPSNEAVVVVCIGCSPAPGPVTNLTFQISGRDVLLQWQAPASGAAPTQYVVEAGTAPGLSNLGQFPTGSASAFVIVANVPPGTYYVRVRALNGETFGPPSNEVVITVP
jgi:hypothetical protein